MKAKAQMAKSGIERKLKYLCRKWRKGSKDFDLAKIQERKHGDYHTSSRYEGEATALRWCAEDLERLL